MKNNNDPIEKLMQSGLSSLTDQEILSTFFRKNKLQNAKKVLSGVDYNLHALARMNVHELVTNCGVSESDASYVVLAMELGRRRTYSEAIINVRIKGSQSVANFVIPMIGDLFYEEFWVIFLNRANRIISTKKLSMGGMTGTVIDVRLVLKAALEQHATSMIFCHNHPSGNLEPSDADKKITQQLKEAAAVMEIPVVDHLIVTQAGYFSFADEGLL